MDVLKEAMGDHVDGWLYNFSSTFQNAFAKLSCAVVSFFSLQASGFYGDEILISLLFKLMILDLGVGVWDAVKNRKWRPGIFLVRGVVKFPMYVLYLFLVASLDHSAERIFKTSLPIVELFCLYLLSGEVYSIARHLRYLGFKVPEPLLWLTFGFKKKTEDVMKDVGQHLNFPGECPAPKDKDSKKENKPAD